MSALSRLVVDLLSTESATSTAIGTPAKKLPHRLQLDSTLVSGTGSNQSDLPYSAVLAVTDTPTLVDVRALTSKLTGSTLTMVEVTGIALKNKSTTTGEFFYVDSGGANPLDGAFKASGDGNKVGPGGLFVLSSPIDGISSDATHKTLQITAATGKTFDVEIWLLGRSA
jgi:hypothetical protein